MKVARFNAVIRIELVSVAVAVFSHLGGANWWIAGAVGFALCNILWSIDGLARDE